MAANRARWSESNVAIQEFNLKHLSAYFGTMLLADITHQSIGKYQGLRQKEGASNRTINMEVSNAAHDDEDRASMGCNLPGCANADRAP
jgi:hypothetical protein